MRSRPRMFQLQDKYEAFCPNIECGKRITAHDEWNCAYYLRQHHRQKHGSELPLDQSVQRVREIKQPEVKP